MKLHNDYQTQTLIDIAGQLAYHEEEVNDIAKNSSVVNDRIVQEDIENISIYMSNYWLNNENEQTKEGSPLQNRRDYFESNYKDTIKQYLENPSELPPIDYCKFGPSNFNCPPDISNKKMYLSVGDIRYGDYDNSTLLFDNDEMPSLVGSINKFYISQKETLDGIDITDITDKKDDDHMIEVISFN